MKPAEGTGTGPVLKADGVSLATPRRTLRSVTVAHQSNPQGATQWIIHHAHHTDAQCTTTYDDRAGKNDSVGVNRTSTRRCDNAKRPTRAQSRARTHDIETT